MRAFEQGYKAFLDGKGQDDNPYDFDGCPYSHKRWKAGWLACKAKRSEALNDLSNLRRRMLARRGRHPDDPPVPFNQSRQEPITRPAGSDEGFIVSEVQRYKVAYASDMNESEHGNWVNASDYDEAQEELSALREENERLKSESFEELYNAAIDERDAMREELAEYQKILLSYKNSYVTKLAYNAVQSSLTAAEQRNAELVELLRKARRSIDPSCAGKALRMELDAALKPTESGASE